MYLRACAVRLPGPNPRASSSLGWSLGNRTPHKLPGAAGPATTSPEWLVYSQGKEWNKNRIVQHGVWVFPPTRFHGALLLADAGACWQGLAFLGL